MEQAHAASGEWQDRDLASIGMARRRHQQESGQEEDHTFGSDLCQVVSCCMCPCHFNKQGLHDGYNGWSYLVRDLTDDWDRVAQLCGSIHIIEGSDIVEL